LSYSRRNALLFKKHRIQKNTSFVK